MSEVDKHRFAQQWARYQQGQEQIQDGTPLDVLFPKNPEIVATLKGSHIHTVQALASVPDSANLPFISDHKKKAAEFLSGLEGGKGFHALEKKLEDSEFARMELEDRIKSLEAKLKSADDEKPGRSRKPEGE
ncbi:hypothetical protein D3C87_1733600 [compost metagenome]